MGVLTILKRTDSVFAIVSRTQTFDLLAGQSYHPNDAWIQMGERRRWELRFTRNDLDRPRCGSENLVVGRASHQDTLLPAKVKHAKGVAYVAHDGTEHEKHDYEVLVRTEIEWIPSSNGEVLPGAVEGGKSESDEALYIGRVVICNQGVYAAGKVDPSHGCLYVSYNGGEVRYNEYELLVQH